MSKTIEEGNKELVLKAFDTLFNKRDYLAAERYWSSNQIQHSAHIELGREGLFNLIKSMPPMFKYKSREIVAEDDFVIVHGRFSGIGQPVNWIAADIVRVKDGVLAEQLGCDRRRGHARTVKKRSSHVRRHISQVTAEKEARRERNGS
jgi:predicted SnoaL-like aldol condensation-catalyzing enzyme